MTSLLAKSHFSYTFSLQSLFDAGLDISQIDVLMIFPTWGTGEGAVYRLDNILITTHGMFKTPVFKQVM